MQGRHRRWALLGAAFAAALVAGCTDKAPPPVTAVSPTGRQPRAAVGPTGQLRWFGYAAGIDEPTLNGTDSYANFGEVITDSFPDRGDATAGVDALARHNMRAVVELGKTLWCIGSSYHELCPDYVQRWETWKTTNPTLLVPGKVLAFIVRDEPFSTGANISSVETAAALVKRDIPGATVLLVENAAAAADMSATSNFNTNAHLISSVDWVGIDTTASILPRTRRSNTP